MSRTGSVRSFFAIAGAMVVTLLLSGASARAQICDVDLLRVAGGTLTAEDISSTGSNFVSDPELEIEIADDLSYVRFENSKIRVVYSGFNATHAEYAIKQFVIKEANEDQIDGGTGFMSAGRGRGPLVAATVIADEAHRKTVRLEWSRWSIPDQAIVPSDKIIIDITIYPNQPFLQFDNLDIRWHTTVADLASPGGTKNGIHIAHGAAGWNRGYITHDENSYAGSYYNRYPPDGVNDPADGGSLNYNEHFIAAVFNPANGRGFGRVVPVAHTSIVKLLLSPGRRGGLETAHHPFFNTHPPFTSYLFAIESGSDPLAIGRSLADSGHVQPRVECGDMLQLTADPYTDWLFSSWTDDLGGETDNPTVVDVVGNLVLSADFDQAPGRYVNDFDALNLGDDPADWFDTSADNALDEDDALFEVLDISGDRVFGTISTDTNIYSHYLGGGVPGGVGYELSGRLKVTDIDGGIGVTVFSQFPSTATYYRLRRFAGTSYHLAPIGTSVTGEGDTGIVPLPDVWYRFRFQVEDIGTRTDLRAMVWKDGLPEPDDWQVEAFDDSASRLTAGSAGLWSAGSGGKYLDDVAIHLLQPARTDLVLTITEVGAGSVIPTPDEIEYTQGDVVTVEAFGSSGEVFAGWSGDLNGVENPSEITMLGDRSVTATFIVPTDHSLTLDVVGQGSIDANPDQSQYMSGEVVELTANPAAGWSFTGWDGALQGIQNPEMLTITGDLQVGASFVEFDLIEDFETVNPGENAPDFYDTGAGNSLTENDALFAVLLVDDEQALGTTWNQVNIHSHYSGMELDGLDSYEFTGRMRLSDLDGGIGVTSFSQFPASAAYYQLRSYGGLSFHLAPTGAGLSGVLDTGVTPVADVWYQFRIEVDGAGSATEVRAKVWAEGNSEPAQWQAQATDSSAARLTSGTVGVWSMADGSKYWDDFKVRPLPAPPTMTLSLDISVIGGGSVNVTPDQALYSPGDLVGLQAIEDPGNLFVGWSGGASGSNSSIDIVMNDDTSVYADFAEILPNPLSVFVGGDGSGSVTVSPDQPTYLTGEVVTLTANPAIGSTFEGWGGDIAESQNPLQLTILGPTWVMAVFDQPEYENTFEGLANGEEPADWVHTGANNSLVESPGLFTVRDVDGQQAFGTDSEQTNQHSHWLGTDSDGLVDYRYTGRFQISDNNSGIGFTVLSQFTDQVAYYRLRGYAGRTMHLASVGTTITRGTTDTGIRPFAGIWYRFIIEVEDTGTETQVRAKVWTEGNAEPELFQVNAADESLSRLRAGTFGVWTMGPGSKALDDVTLSVPEPSSVTMLVAGVGLLSVFGRRRSGLTTRPAFPRSRRSGRFA